MVLSLLVLGPLVYNVDTFIGQCKFKRLCESESGGRVYQVLEPNAGWLVGERVGDSFAFETPFSFGPIGFVRAQDKTGKWFDVVENSTQTSRSIPVTMQHMPPPHFEAQGSEIGNSMTFVNEYISPQESVAYGIKEIDKRYVVGGTSSTQWTIDRERNIYLRQVANGPREIEMFHQGVWTLWFEDELIEVGIDNLSSTGGLHGPGTGHKAIRYIDLPSHLEARRGELIDVLREALLVYKNGGVYSSSFPFSLTLDM